MGAGFSKSRFGVKLKVINFEINNINKYVFIKLLINNIGGGVIEYFSKYIFYFLVSTESLKKYCHYFFNVPKVWGGGQTDWWWWGPCPPPRPLW
jgi:hypothetical protein